MENKIKYVMEPGTRVPRAKFSERFGWKSKGDASMAKRLAYAQLIFLLGNVYFYYFSSFRATIWASQRAGSLLKSFPTGEMDKVFVSSGNEMEISLRVNEWSSTIYPYFFSHMLSANIKFVIVFFICLKIADIFKMVSEKHIFEEENIKTFRLIGFALLSIPIFDRLAIYIMTLYVSHYPELFANLKIQVHQVSFAHIFPQHAILYFVYAQLFYLTIIEIFRQGLELKSENDLTV